MSNKKYKNKIIELHGYKCCVCFITEWRGEPLCLELDHIDGNNSNNNLDNLRLLCPNCHAQTKTFRGRNKNSGHTKISDEELLIALQTTSNIRQALIKVGLTPKGLNYTRASKLINAEYEKTIDTKNSQYGTCWIHNHKINKKIKKNMLEEYLEQGWVRGRINTTVHSSNKNKFWVTNGTINKIVSTIPDGYWRGRAV